MSEKPDVAKLFDAVAETYDAVGVDFFGPIARGLIEAVGPQPGERALDVGCGRGAALIPLARAVGPTGSARGIDLSPRMVELAQAAAAEADVVAQVEVGDAMAPAVEPGSVDVLVSSLVLFFLPDPAAALEAWRALLVDGGRIGVSTFGPYSQQWRDEVDARLQRRIPRTEPDARSTGTQGPFASDAGMEALLRDAGFQDVRTETATVSPRFDDPEHWFRWSMSDGQRRLWMQVPEDELPAVKQDVFEGVERCRDEQGRIGFDQEVRRTLARR